MKKTNSKSGFALALTLVLLVLIVIVVVAYLVSTRIERSTSSVYANRLRAKIQADSGLAAGIHLLKDNTRYGNYVTAMPAPVPTPASIYTEIYRPADPASSTYAVKADDYLRLDNAAGEVLISRGVASSAPGPDPRPTPEPIPTPLAASSPFTVTAPTFSPTPDYYDFNQIVTIGTTTGRLVQPSPSPAPPPAYGGWVNVRDANSQLIGRYAFFIEDESMKVNVNFVGNASGVRNNDLTLPGPSPVPDQIQEIDPGAILPMRAPTPNRILANSTLAGLGSAGSRVSSRSTLGLLNEWKNTFPDYAHMITIFSKDDNTTARGWQRLDLNALASGLATPAQKKPVAMKIANWIRDAWTGPTAISSLIGTQMFGDDRLRQQIAANIVDYIAPVGAATDMGDISPNASVAPTPTPVPVIGIEKIPYVHSVELIYQAASASPSPLPTPWPTPGTYTTTIKMKLQFRFINLFESDLALSNQIGTIEITGVPTIRKNGANVFSVPATQKFIATVPSGTPNAASDLRPLKGSGDLVPKGIDGTSSSGVRTFQTDWVATQTPSFTVLATNDKRPQIVANGLLNVRVLGKNGERLDVFAVTIGTQTTGYYYGKPGSSSSYSPEGDFVAEANNADGSARSPSPQIACINRTSHVAGPNAATADFGDPRYHGPALTASLTDRWDNDSSRTDATCGPAPSASPCAWVSIPYKINRIDEFTDQAELNCRYAVDWYDYDGDRPLAFIRNGPMLNIGELGNIATCEYPWRTLYLQHSERPANTRAGSTSLDVPTRRKQSIDYVLADLFRAGGTFTRSGALNINTQLQYLAPGGTTTTLPLESLFVGTTIGLPNVTPTPQPLTQAGPSVSPSPADRVSTGINLLVSETTVPPSGSAWQGTTPLNYRIASVSNKRSALVNEIPTADNNPPRPYFQIGELAPTLSRLTSASEASDSSSTSSTSHVAYSALRTNPIVLATPAENYRKDFEVEQLFREVSNSITTRGNVFRVLYVGQAIKDINKNGMVDSQSEIQAEYLGEAFVERDAVFTQDSTNADVFRTTDSTYKMIANRVVTE